MDVAFWYLSGARELVEPRRVPEPASPAPVVKAETAAPKGVCPHCRKHIGRGIAIHRKHCKAREQ